MVRTIKLIAIYVIIFASVGVAMNILFGENTMIYLNYGTLKDTNLSWYRIDFLAYKDNLQTYIQNTTELKFEIPTREWLRNPSSLDEFWNQLVNNLAVILDYIILILNVLIYPLRLGGYLLRFIVALLGLNVGTNSSLNWLGEFISGLMNIAIPYV